MDVAVSPLARQPADLAGCRIDPEDRLFERVIGRNEQAPAVPRPFDRSDGAVPILGESMGPASRNVAKHQYLTVGFIGRTCHGHVGKRTTIGRNGWQRVGCLVCNGQVDRSRAAVAWHGEYIEVGRFRFEPSGFPKHEIKVRAVGRKGDVFGASERFCRRIANKTSGERNAVSDEFAARHRESEQARSHAGLNPAVPMANEQLIEGAARAGVRLVGQPSAIEVDAAKIAIGPDHQTVPRRRKAKTSDVSLEAANLNRCPTDCHPEQLVLISRPASRTTSSPRDRRPHHVPLPLR